MVVDEALVGLLRAEVLERVCPQQITHEAVRRRFPEAVDLRRAGGSARQVLQTALPLTFRRSSSVCSSGERPPWMQRNCLFMMAASGRVQKASMHAS